MDNQNYAAQFYSGISNEIDLLEKNIEENPASSVVRFMWLYHLNKNNDSRFKEVAKQTGIYLNNPLWMDYQLSKSENATNTVNARLNEPLGQEEIPQNPILENEATEINNDEIINETSKEIEQENPVDFNEQKTEEEIFPSTVNEEILQNPILENESTEINYDEIINEPSKEIEQENPVDFNEQKTKEEISPETVNKEIPQNPILENGATKINNDEHVIQENPAEENEIISDEARNPNENQDEDKSIPFEPLHTLDYFASQGIKLSEEALANDQLGQQVKSFTAWLKSMKKLHPGQLPEQNEVIEKIIQSSSEVSNQNANVLTEAMAEVLVKQGKREKAVEMYEKLSLINPSKSAYFAAKIEILKTV